MENGKKELNLTDVIILCGKGIVKFFLLCIKAIGWCLRLLYQHKWLFICFVAAGIAFGYIYSKVHTYYKAGFTLSVRAKDPYFCSKIVQSIDEKCGDPKLADMLGIDSTIAASIQSITPYFIVDINEDNVLDFIDYKETYKSDTVKIWSKQFLYIEMVAREDSFFQEIKDGIIHYLCQDEALQEDLNVKMKNEEQWVNVLNKEMDQILAVQDKIYTSNITPQLGIEEKDKTSGLFSESRVQLFLEGKVYIMDQICAHIIRLERYKKGPVQGDFPIEMIGKEESTSSGMVKFGLYGFLLAFVITVFLKYRKNIKAYLEGE